MQAEQGEAVSSQIASCIPTKGAVQLYHLKSQEVPGPAVNKSKLANFVDHESKGVQEKPEHTAALLRSAHKKASGTSGQMDHQIKGQMHYQT